MINPGGPGALRRSYADAPEFGIEVLHPRLDQGADLYIVGEFLPSYCISLARALAQTPRVEPGKLNLVLGIPFSQEFENNPSLFLANFLASSLTSLDIAEQFIRDSLFLIAEGSLSFTLLRSLKGAQISTGCVGLISSRGRGGESIIFTDLLPGDNNSPIRPISDSQSSSEDEAQAFDELMQVIEQAIFTTPPGVSRVTQDVVTSLFEEIIKKSWLKKSFPDSSISIPQRRKTPSRSGKSEESWFAHQDLGRLLDEVNRGIMETDLTEAEFVERFFGKEKQAAFYRFFGFSRL